MLTNKNAVQSAWIGWAVLFLVTSAIIVVDGTRSVVPTYRIAALSWLDGQGLYNGDGVGGFVYFQQAAILFVPFAMFSPAVGELLWRLVTIGAFAAGLLSFAQLAGKRPEKQLFPLMTLVALPLAWDCARNGQATLLITGLMLLAVGDVAQGSWWRATLWLALGVAVKPLAIVLVLLIMVIDRPMSWRLLLGMGAGALSPFLFGRPAYVLQQYSVCLNNMTMAAHVGAMDMGWTSPFSALRLIGIDVSERVQTMIRLVFAAVTLALCVVARRRHEAPRSAVFVFSLAVVYLILFSPRSEDNTYAMLGPAIAVFLSRAFLSQKRKGDGLLLCFIALVMVGSRVLERLLTPHAGTSWMSPLMAACFAVYLLVRLYTYPPDDRLSEAGRKRNCWNAMP